MVDHGVRIVVRPARFTSVHVPARHHVWGIPPYWLWRCRLGNVEEVTNYEIRRMRRFCHHSTAVVQLIGFHPDARISPKVRARPRI